MSDAGRAASDSVLVVEDDPAVRRLLEVEIGELGHPVTAVADVVSALRAVKDQSFSLAVADIRLPDGDGIALLKRLKAGDPDVEMIIVTGHASVATAIEAVRLGASDYLTKPLDDLEVLAISLTRARSRRRERLAARVTRYALDPDADGWSHLVDRWPHGVILCDEKGVVRSLNRRALAITGEGDGLRLDPVGRLRASTPRASKELYELLQRVDATDGGSMRIARVGRDDLTLLVTTLGVHASAEVLAVVVADRNQSLPVASSALAHWYGLTATESRVALQMMRGKSVEAISDELGISTNTARTHLKRIYAKTHTCGQADLVRVLLTGPMVDSAEDHEAVGGS